MIIMPSTPRLRTPARSVHEFAEGCDDQRRRSRNDRQQDRFEDH